MFSSVSVRCMWYCNNYTYVTTDRQNWGVNTLILEKFFYCQQKQYRLFSSNIFNYSLTVTDKKFSLLESLKPWMHWDARSTPGLALTMWFKIVCVSLYKENLKFLQQPLHKIEHPNGGTGSCVASWSRISFVVYSKYFDNCEFNSHHHNDAVISALFFFWILRRSRGDNLLKVNTCNCAIKVVNIYWLLVIHLFGIMPTLIFQVPSK